MLPSKGASPLKFGAAVGSEEENSFESGGDETAADGQPK